MFSLSATPFNAKAQLQSRKFNTHTPTSANYSTPQQHAPPNDQWPTGPAMPSNHLQMQTQHPQPRVMNNIQSMPIQHQQPLNNK